MAEPTTGLTDLRELPVKLYFQTIMFQHAHLNGNKLYKLYWQIKQCG